MGCVKKRMGIRKRLGAVVVSSITNSDMHAFESLSCIAAELQQPCIVLLETLRHLAIYEKSTANHYRTESVGSNSAGQTPTLHVTPSFSPLPETKCFYLP